MVQGQETFENAVQLADGDYVVVLAVYHELHCLVSLQSLELFLCRASRFTSIPDIKSHGKLNSHLEHDTSLHILRTVLSERY